MMMMSEKLRLIFPVVVVLVICDASFDTNIYT